MMNEQLRLVDLGRGIESPLGRRLYAMVGEPVIERLLSVSKLNRLYEHAREPGRDVAGRSFFQAALDTLAIRYQLSDDELTKIPAEGPVVVVANHPFGVIDGFILGDILTRRRADVRLSGSAVLDAVPECRPWTLVDARGASIDPFAEAGAEGRLGGLKAGVKWLRAGGLLAVFPAGEVSSLQIRDGEVSDPAWDQTVAALVRRTRATAVPLYFQGRNSAVFQLASLIHPTLGQALLPRELWRRRRSTVEVRIGKALPPSKTERFAEDAVLVDYLRWKTYRLADRDSPVRPRFIPRPTVAAAPTPIIEPIGPALLASDIEALPASARLVEQGDFQICIARAAEIPNLLREIGRLREVTFRAVGEGSGRACDLDQFDETYLHLFMWNKKTQEVVGSYRIGLVDELLARGGQEGLYTSTLFKWKAGFLERVGAALELGRSFVRVEYQRKASSLALVWRGIGEFLVRNPRYKVLLGPVSISREYDELSRRVMVELLEETRGDEVLAAMVTPRNPPRERLARKERKVVRALVKDVDDISALISDIETDEKGMPVLLKHYLKLNAKLLGFNVDPAFGHCVDGLIVVDLRTTAPKILKRFMGEDGYAAYAAVSGGDVIVSAVD